MKPGRKGFSRSIQSPGSETATTDRSKAVFRLLNRVQIPYPVKTVACELIERDLKSDDICERLTRIGLNDGLCMGMIELHEL